MKKKRKAKKFKASVIFFAVGKKQRKRHLLVESFDADGFTLKWSKA